MSELSFELSDVRPSLVSRVNPSLKLFLHMVCMMLMVFTDDPITTLVLALIPILTTLLLANVSIRTFFTRLWPFLIAFVMVTFMLSVYGKGSHVIWQGGIWRVTQEGVSHGLNIGMRMFGFAAYGLLFSATTDVTLLVLSLMQQCKLPPKLAYALLAGFRFLPTFKEEFEQLKAAHRVRGVARVPGIRGKLEAFGRYTIPLLAQAIRKAERVVVALEARGFDGSWNRTFYREIGFSAVDALYSVLLLGLTIAVLVWV